MKSFNQFITERRKDANILFSMLNSGEFQDLDDFSEFMDSENWIKPLGNGYYSMVYGSKKHSEVVCKVTEDSHRDPWYKFAKIAQKNWQSNSLFPEILYIYEGFEESTDAVAFFEHLDIAENMHYPSEVVYKPFRQAVETILFNKLPNENNSIEYFNENIKRIQHIFDYPPNFTPEIFVDFCKKAKNIWKYSYSVDLHEGNIGFRKNGEMVLFDPAS